MRRPNVKSLFAYQTYSWGPGKSRGFSPTQEVGRAISVAPRRGAEAGWKALGDGGFPDVRRRMERMFRLYRPARRFADVVEVGGPRPRSEQMGPPQVRSRRKRRRE